MKKLLIIPVFVFFVALLTAPTFAASKKPFIPISVIAVYVRPKNSVNTTFANVKSAKKISYTLMYEGNGIGQGVMGSIVPGKMNVITRSLYLGTCSNKVCLPQKNIKNITLEVTTNYTNGSTTTKTYKVK